MFRQAATLAHRKLKESAGEQLAIGLGIHTEIQKALCEFLLHCQFTIDEMGTSPKSIGDKVQEVITNNFSNIYRRIAEKQRMKFADKEPLSLRAFADAAFSMGQRYFAFDVKTRNIEAGFHVPNTKSVERLARFYSSNQNVLVIISVDYQLNLKEGERRMNFSQVVVAPIEQVSCQCLRLGKLGYGLIQVEPNRR